MLVCKKDLKVIVISFYKITDKNKSMDLDTFMVDVKKGEEEKSYKVHSEILKYLTIKSFHIENSLAAKGDLLTILE